MADIVTVTSPDFTGTVDQQFFLAPLGGPQHPQTYLERFPEEIYNKGIDSHLVKYMYALLGPAGVGWLRKNYLEARLKLEDYGIETFDLDGFYGDPLSFPRILEEVYDQDPGGLIPRDRWEEIRAKDAKYRNRAIDYVNGARAGNTPFGMRLVARSGLGHEVEIIENYRYIYDQLSDDRLGLVNFGSTDSTEEMIVVPRRELPQSEVQILEVQGVATGGTFTLFFPMGNEVANSTAPIAYNASRSTIQSFLESIPTIGVGNVVVRGGPLPSQPIEIAFTRKLAFRNVPQLQISNSLTGTTVVTMTLRTDRDGTDQTDEIVALSDLDKHHLKEALSRIKPVTTIVSFAQSKGLTTRQTWNSAFAGSVYNEVVRYVTGQAGINWPTINGTNWIEGGTEHEGPRSLNDLKQHYQGFHNIASVTSYTELALADPNYATDVAELIGFRNEHIGNFSNYQKALYPVLTTPQGINASQEYQFTADKALADYAEPLTVNATTNSSGTNTQLINGIYPTTYQTLPGVPDVRYKEEQFYASIERPEGQDYIEIDLGQPQAVNFLYMDITRKPYDVSIDYEILDLAPSRAWAPVVFDSDHPAPTHIGYESGTTNPWINTNYHFTNSLGQMIYTRFIRLKFARRPDINSPFVASDGTKLPYSIEIRNLRVGRNIS